MSSAMCGYITVAGERLPFLKATTEKQPQPLNFVLVPLAAKTGLACQDVDWGPQSMSCGTLQGAIGSGFFRSFGLQGWGFPWIQSMILASSQEWRIRRWEVLRGVMIHWLAEQQSNQIN